MKPNTFNLQNRGTIGKSVGKLRVNDAMSDFIVCRAHDHVLYFRYFQFALDLLYKAFMLFNENEHFGDLLYITALTSSGSRAML